MSSVYIFLFKLELEEVGVDLKEREIKARDCMIDASKMAEELHSEQEQSGIFERERKALETKVRDLQVNYEIFSALYV